MLIIVSGLIKPDIVAYMFLSPTVWHKVRAEWINNPVQGVLQHEECICICQEESEKPEKIHLFITSQIFLMFPYYSIKLIGRDSKIYKNLVTGLKDGLKYHP